MMEPSPEDLRALLALQDTDLELRRFRSKLESLPEQQVLDERLARQREIEKQRSDLHLDVQDAENRIRKGERELEILRERLGAEHQRLYSGELSSPREIQSQRAEIDSTERRIDEHETVLLEAMEALETVETRDAELAAASEQLTSGIAEAEAARDAAAEGLLASIAELEVQAEAQRGSIEADLLRRYDEAGSERGGRALGALEDGMCTACRIEFPKVEANALRKGPPLSTCPQCRRLLVIL